MQVNIKKFLIVILSISLLIGCLVGCKKKNNSATPSDVGSEKSSSQNLLNSNDSSSSSSTDLSSGDDVLSNDSSQEPGSNFDDNLEQDTDEKILDLRCMDDHPGIPGYANEYTMKAYYDGLLLNSNQYTLKSSVEGVIFNGNKVIIPDEIKQKNTNIVIEASLKKDSKVKDAYPFKIKKWSNTFNDDFNSSKLDSTKWSSSPSFLNEPTGWAVNPNSPYLKDGKLILPVEKREFTFNQGGQAYNAKYSASSIETKNKFSQQYGCFMASIKLPKAGGGNTAFWLLPNEGNWGDSYLFKNQTTGAFCGEIDVVEQSYSWGNEFQVTDHYWFADQGSPTPAPGDAQRYTFDNLYDGFHSYAVVWNETAKYTYYDGKLIKIQNNLKSTGQEAYILVDLYLGGLEGVENSWVGTFKDSDLPFAAEVDYIRAYK